VIVKTAMQKHATNSIDNPKSTIVTFMWTTKTESPSSQVNEAGSPMYRASYTVYDFWSTWFGHERDEILETFRSVSEDIVLASRLMRP